MSSQPPTVIDLGVDEHMRKSFIDYAMSVIQDRALPDVRDGLKPVHRRILYAMREMGLTPEKTTRKSAGVVGEVLKLYHPHGDGSVYEAAVRMAQPWSLLHPLITGQGNFGSIDGDGPAAYRYTEMKLAKIALNFFVGIDKETVDVRDNFDATTTEPTILPVNFPNILVNGTDGIAVGMATSLPPHNLREVADAVFAYLDNREIGAREIAQIMVAPDFPTGGVVHDLEGYVTALETGRGSVKLRATWHEETQKNRTLLVLDSVPYQSNKSTLVERIAELVNAKSVEDVTDLRDESSKGGVRVVIELRKGASAEHVFNQLVARRTGLEVTIAYNAMLLAGKQPRQMNVREILERWVAFRLETIRRAAQYDVQKARDRLHVLAGFVKAIGLMDRVIATIRASKDAPQAKIALMNLLEIDDIQAQAILELRLAKLTGLELAAIAAEHASVTATVRDLAALIASERRQTSVLRKDLKAVVDAHGVDRRTTVQQTIARLSREELTVREDVVVFASANGYVKRVAAAATERGGRGARAKNWLATSPDDVVEDVFSGSTHDYLLALTARGQLHAKKLYDVPETSPGGKGRHVRNVIDGIEADDAIVKLFMLPDFVDDRYLVTVTRAGAIKRTRLAEYAGAVRRGGIAAAKLDGGDALVAGAVARDYDHIVLGASNGKAIRFVADDEGLRPLGRAAGGTRGIKLERGERVVGMAVVAGNGTAQATHTITREIDGAMVRVHELDTRAMDRDRFLICVGERGLGKKTAFAEFGVQARGGKGVACYTINAKSGPLVRVLGSDATRDLAIFSSKGAVTRAPVDAVRTTPRTWSGSALVTLDRDDSVVEARAVPREPQD
ncbi:MAG: DNA gyrase subunit A [Vulcanimicrobiaceae bacterium]